MIELSPDELINYCANHEVSEESFKFWFDFFNRIIFDGKIEAPEVITVRRMRGYWGRVLYYNSDVSIGDDCALPLEWYEIEMHNNLNLRNFFDMLCHEMVHLYQGQILNNFEFPEPEDDEDGTFDLVQSALEPYGIYIL